MVASEPAQAERLADVLGLIGHRSALPFLADVRTMSTVANVKSAAERAINRIDAASVQAGVADAVLQGRSQSLTELEQQIAGDDEFVEVEEEAAE